MRHLSRAVPAAALAVVLAAALTACGADDGAPSSAGPAQASPSPSPSLDEAERAEQEHVEEAKAALAEYYEASDDVANDGYEGWQSLRGYMGPQAWKSESSILELNATDGWSTTGRVELVSMTVVEYVEDPTGSGFEQVRIDVCSDVSSITVHDDEGDVVPRDESLPDSFTTVYTLQHQGPGEGWLINGRDAEVEQSC
ncbi:hypothetical protein GCM10009718_27860 [Isoptericola halotolerans]|uniref:Lipoprotein n=1 Tax=Isoptericola halotolerans TaxID=300560 RepID=A0ABX2A3D5_9MICO|nr:hypothetical protein [Isoptericola halotolerans]NOV97364.1 hypothetical protein [Isoptericola halotolerans]